MSLKNKKKYLHEEVDISPDMKMGYGELYYLKVLFSQPISEEFNKTILKISNSIVGGIIIFGTGGDINDNI